MAVLTDSVAQKFMARLILLLIWMFFAMGALIFPLAKVAESFEYDALRIVNTPEVLHHAQRLYGQTLLAHVQLLNWGFRIGGLAINMRMGVQVIMALAVTTLATVS